MGHQASQQRLSTYNSSLISMFVSSSYVSKAPININILSLSKRLPWINIYFVFCHLLSQRDVSTYLVGWLVVCLVNFKSQSVDCISVLHVFALWFWGSALCPSSRLIKSHFGDRTVSFFRWRGKREVVLCFTRYRQLASIQSHASAGILTPPFPFG